LSCYPIVGKPTFQAPGSCALFTRPTSPSRRVVASHEHADGPCGNDRVPCCVRRADDGREHRARQGFGGHRSCDRPPAGACDDARLVTLEAIAGGAIDGERVAIDVAPVAKVECTEMDCGDRECCNRCEGTYGIALRREPADRDLELTFTGLDGCSGMGCNLHCEPFGRAPTTRYRFVGKLSFRPAGVTAIFHQAALEVENYCRMP
jgi:hypothetical protein